MTFISLEKLFFLEIYKFLLIFSLPFRTFQIQKDNWKWNDFIGFHKFTDVLFGLTQKPLCITSSNLVRQYER